MVLVENISQNDGNYGENYDQTMWYDSGEGIMPNLDTVKSRQRVTWYRPD